MATVNDSNDADEAVDMRMGYSVQTFTAGKFSQHIKNITTPELAVSSTQMLVRAPVRKFETFLVMSHLVEGDEILRHMLRKKDVRDELEAVVSRADGLTAVLTSLFGMSGNAEVNSPRYSSQNVINAVDTAAVYKSSSVTTRLFIAACLSDMLDAFKMRQEAASSSWIETHSGSLHITSDELISSLVEASIADKVKHELVKVRKDLESKAPPKRFNIFAFAQLMHVTLRNIAMHLNAVTYTETYIRNILQLVARHVVNNDSQSTTYGAPRSNTSIEPLLKNSSVVRIAMELYDKSMVLTIPAHEVKHEADTIARNLSNLTNYDVISDTRQVIQLNGFNRSQTGALVSAVINGVRKSAADAHVYMIIKHDDQVDGFVDVINKTKQFGAMIPKVPDGTLDRLITDTVIVTEELSMNNLRSKYTSLNLARADVSAELQRDATALLCPVFYQCKEKAENGSTYDTIYLVSDVESRLRALSPSNFSEMMLNDVNLAFAVVAPMTTEGITTQPLYSTEALIIDGKFTGVWANRKTTSLSDVQITIKDLINDGKGEAQVPSFTLPLFGDKSVLPKFTEMSTTDGWANIITLVNTIADELNAPGNQKGRLQRTAWVTSFTTLLADWVNKDVAIHSLVMRATTAFSFNAQAAKLPEEYYWTHSYYHGMIALQCVVGALNAMSQMSDKPEVLNEAVIDMLFDVDSLMTFSRLVSSAH